MVCARRTPRGTSLMHALPISSMYWLLLFPYRCAEELRARIGKREIRKPLNRTNRRVGSLWIVTPAEAKRAAWQDTMHLISALAQTRLWLEQLLSGEVSRRMIAAAAGKSERYVSKHDIPLPLGI